MKDIAANQPIEKLVYTCEEIQEIFKIIRTTAYRLIKTHFFHTVRIGGQYRISKKSFDAWLQNEGGQNE